MNREYWILFCNIFHMDVFLHSLTPNEVGIFKYEMYILLNEFQKSPQAGKEFQRDVAYDMFENILRKIPGSLSVFTNYIQPHTQLRAAFLRLGEMLWLHTSLP